MASNRCGPNRHGLGRRDLLAAGGAGALATLAPRRVAADAPSMALPHGFSPLGALRYGAAFNAFDYVNPDAPKGGALRFAHVGGFNTTDTLRYPGRPPADIRMIYDRLIVASDDETASYYGVLAQGIAVSADFTEITIALNDAARWQDGQPVTVEDVVFTFETLKAEGAPFYRQAFRSLDVVAEGSGRVRILNNQPDDRDVIRKIATIPIHPAHVWQDAPSGDPSHLPVGSGPYRVAAVDPPDRLVLERAPDYWGRDLAVNRGRWNFDRLTFDYYRSPEVALEAFLADDYDVRLEDSPTRWYSGYAGPGTSSGAIRRAESRLPGPGTLHGLVVNLRNPTLADRGVRLALALSYDFDTVNRTLFAGAYQRLDSVFAETELAARGRAGEAERSILTSSGETLPPALFDDPDPLAALPTPGTRPALAEASRLLDAAGVVIRDGRRIDPATGAPLQFTVLPSSALYDRPLAWIVEAFERLGIGMVRIQTDPANAARRMLDRDFDLATMTWAPARLPGTAERLLWHSALADAPGSYALSGITSPALDAAIEALERARTPTALAAAGRAFDRVFRHTLVMVPLWRSNAAWLAWWDRFGRPQSERAGFPSSPLDRWWSEDA